MAIRSRRQLRKTLVPWVVAAVGVWLVFDNAPALIEEWRLLGSPASGTATVVSVSGGRPTRWVRRISEDLFWGRGRRVTYELAPSSGARTSGAAFVTHSAADGLQPGGAVAVRYHATDPAVLRLEGEPGILLLSFRLVLALALLVLVGFWLLRPSRSAIGSSTTAT